MRARFSSTRLPSIPWVWSAVSSDNWPVKTRLPIMSGAKRAPSSLVKKATANGCSVSMPASLSVAMTSSPASTPRLPSKRPPVRTVSMCDPVITAGPATRPARVPTTLPMASIVTANPSSRIQWQTRSRPALSSSESARRAQPPPSMAPMAASSAKRRCRRAPSMRNDGFMLPLLFVWISLVLRQSDRKRDAGCHCLSTAAGVLRILAGLVDNGCGRCSPMADWPGSANLL